MVPIICQRRGGGLCGGLGQEMQTVVEEGDPSSIDTRPALEESARFRRDAFLRVEGASVALVHVCT